MGVAAMFSDFSAQLARLRSSRPLPFPLLFYLSRTESDSSRCRLFPSLLQPSFLHCPSLRPAAFYQRERFLVPEFFESQTRAALAPGRLVERERKWRCLLACLLACLPILFEDVRLFVRLRPQGLLIWPTTVFLLVACGGCSSF